SGKFLLSSIMNQTAKTLASSERILDRFNTLTIKDGVGREQTLYFGTDANGEIPLAFYEMPPLPPSGAFDVRFESENGGLMLQTHATDVKGLIEFPVRIQTESFPISVSWKIKGESISYKLADGLAGKEFNSSSLSGEGSLIIDRIARLVLKVSGEVKLPTVYALEQNYPNPFNPSTTIKFSVPEEVNVNLSIFNLLGERVKELKNDLMKPGYYEVEFNASALASGIYFYRIKAGDFIDTRKMLLLK
ncbi:MAG: T9SS type A sorting domain-containing protein, partial [Ignavibacteria bacterium]|nr:T9SS type A sorting domain-containing protein [Ignavibacteria bacterium]